MYIYTYTYVYIYVYMYISTIHIYIYIYVYIYVCIYIHIHMYICMCICIYIQYIYIHIHPPCVTCISSLVYIHPWATRKSLSNQLTIHELISSGSQFTGKRLIPAVRDSFIYTLSYAEMYIHLNNLVYTLADNPRTPFVGLAHHTRTSHPWLIHLHT